MMENTINMYFRPRVNQRTSDELCQKLLDMKVLNCDSSIIVQYVVHGMTVTPYTIISNDRLVNM